MRTLIAMTWLVSVATVGWSQNYQVVQPQSQSLVVNQPMSLPASPSVQEDRSLAETPENIQSGGFPTLGAFKNEASGSSPEPTKGSLSTPMVTTCSALAVVLGLFAALVWVSRKYGSKTLSGTLPTELVEVLGTSTLDVKTQVMMLRIGSRIVVAARGPQGVQPLSEITDLDEVQHIVSLCNGNAKATFNTTLQDFHNEPAAGFAAATAPVKRSSRLFATA